MEFQRDSSFETWHLIMSFKEYLDMAVSSYFHLGSSFGFFKNTTPCYYRTFPNAKIVIVLQITWINLIALVLWYVSFLPHILGLRYGKLLLTDAHLWSWLHWNKLLCLECKRNLAKQICHIENSGSEFLYSLISILGEYNT